MHYQFGDYSLDTENLEFKRSGDLVALEPQVFRLIVCLIENRDRVVPKDDLIKMVWDQRIITDGALNTCINSARNAVGDDGKTQTVIKTFPRRGFRFMADVVESQTDHSRAKPEISPLPDKPSIAVLPFNNLSDDPQQEYFSDGLAEDLITDISKISGLFVIARNSSFAFKGQAMDVKEIANKLGVKHVVEGSVRKMGSRLRISAQLIDASTGGHMWAERYDGDMENIFEFQDDIRDQIVAALQVTLTVQEAAQPRQRVTDNVEAYEVYLRARSEWHRVDPEGTLAAKHLMREAIEIDPHSAAAYAELSGILQQGWSFVFPGFEDAFDEMLDAAQRAVDLDDGLAQAHSRLGWALTFYGRYDEAIASLERAIALGPFDSETHLWFGEFLNYAGDPARGAQVGARAFELEPGANGIFYFCSGHSHYLLRDHDRAIELFEGAIARVPGFPLPYLFLGIVYFELGRKDDAAVQFAKLHDVLPPQVLDVLVDRLPYRDDEPKRRMRNALERTGGFAQQH